MIRVETVFVVQKKTASLSSGLFSSFTSVYGWILIGS
jgi:hypothetical protein